MNRSRRGSRKLARRVSKKHSKRTGVSGVDVQNEAVEHEGRTGADRIKELMFPSGNVQSFLPVDYIKNGIIKLKGKAEYVKILEINPSGFSKMKNKDKAVIIQRYQQFLKTAPDDFQVKIMTEKTDVAPIIRQYTAMYKSEKNPYVKKAREDNLKLLTNLSYNESMSKRYFLIFKYHGNVYTGDWADNEEQIAREMRDEANYINQNLKKVGNNLVHHTNEDAFLKETLYRYFNPQSSVSETVQDRYERLERDLSDVQFNLDGNWEEAVVPDSSLIASRGIKPGYDYIIVDGVYYSFIAMKEDMYPTRVLPAWINNYANAVCDVDIYFQKEDRDRAIDSVERSISQHSVLMKYQNEKSSQDDMLDAINAASYLLDRVRQHDDFYYCMILFTIKGKSYEDLRINRGMIQKMLRQDAIGGSVALAENEEYYKMAMPFMQINKDIFKRFRHNMTTESASSCYPFDEQRLKDEDGMIIGKSTYGGHALAAFNNFDTHRYVNANIGIFGPSGSGKSYFSMLLARRLRLNNIGVFFVLPIKGYEYKYSTETLGGQFIDFSGGTQYCVNLFDIPAEEDLDAQTLADLEVTAKSHLQQKLIEISTFFELLLNEPNGIDREAAANLDTAVVKLYKSYGITSDNNSLYDANGQKKVCPTIGDFYDSIKDDPDMKAFTTVLKPFIYGRLSNFNGQTNVDLSNKMIAFDVSNNDSTYMPVLIFLALNCCYGKMRENRTDKYALFIDEGWKMMNNQNSSEFVNELVKIVRGYAGSAIFATQNLRDVVNRPCGESIISNMASKFLLQIGNGEDEINRTLFKLTDEQMDEIQSQEKGHISLIANKEIYAITTATSKIEDATYTTDPSKVKEAKKLVEAFLEDVK